MASPATSRRSGSATAPRGADPEAVRELLARVAGGGRSPSRIDTHETHISWVFVVGERAFKLRKPVVLPFLDYGTPDRRRAMCEAEVALGRRLAPHMYRGVRALVPDGDRLALVTGGDPRAVDYLVEMTAFAQEATLAAAVEADAVPGWLADRLGARLAAFHAACAEVRVPDGAAHARREISANLLELRELGGGGLDARLDRYARFLAAATTLRAGLLDRRGRGGRIREGHGDLRAEHVVLAPELAIIDCLEFDPAMRSLDTADEVSFLVMDLLRLDAERFGRDLLDAYRRAGGDCGDDGLVWMFAVHRALVRAKVTLLRAGQLGAATADGHPARLATAEELFRAADRCAWRARSIDVLVICGGSATGKSTLAAALSARLALPCVQTDVVRKELLGLSPTEPAGPGAYSPAMGVRTYATLGERARALLATHPSVIVDGTFRRGDERAAFLAALGKRPSIVFVQCCVPLELARRRARERQHSRERQRAAVRASDATEEIVLAQGAPPAPFADIAPGAQIILRADRDPESIEADLDAVLDARMTDPGG